MKLCYQATTSDVVIADSVTAYQGPLAKTFGSLDALGYNGVELMALNPEKPDRREVKRTAEENNLPVVLVRTGEIFGRLGLSYTHPHRSLRREAMERTKEVIDFVGYLGANVNTGRVRGQYCRELDGKETIELAQNTFTELTDYAVPKNVDTALETVTIIQANFVNTLVEGAAIAGRVGRPNFRLVMDIFHLNLEEKDLYETIHAYSSYNIHVHLADNNRRYSSQYGLDFEKILTAFRECGCNGNYCTEIFQLPSMGEAVRESIRYLGPIADRVYDRNTHRNEASRNKDGRGRSRKEGMQI